VFKVGRLLKLGAENGDVMLYPDYLQAHLSVECLRRILVGQRSQLYDIAITSKFGHELLAYQLLHCAKDGSLAKKVASEDSIFRINQSIQLLEGRESPKQVPPIGTISEEERTVIIRCIIQSASINQRKVKRRILRTARAVAISSGH